MRRGWAAVLVVSAVALALVAVSLTARDGQELDLDPLVDRVVASGSPGVFVALRENGSLRTWQRGVAASSQPIDAGQRFRIGSITKTFVATLVLMLEADQRLSLDDTVGHWLPGLIPDERAITVRQLLSHTSGLFDYVDDPRITAAAYRRWGPEELIRLAASHPPTGPPGHGFAYSSTNYVVLGLVAERAGRAPLGRQLRARLFEPLELRSTSFVPGIVDGTYVHGHRPPSHQGVVTGPPVDTADEPAWWAGAAGAIVSTAEDLQRFFAALLGGEVLGSRQMAEMTRLVPAGAYRYGLGLATFPTPCGPAWGHTGNTQGTVAVAWNTRDAARQLVLVVNVYPLSGALEAAVRRLQDAAFCEAEAGG